MIGGDLHNLVLCRQLLDCVVYSLCPGNPDITIQTAPVGVTSKSDIAIWFDLATAMAPSVSFACRLDHISQATNCTSPFRRHSLEEGSHTLVITPSLPGNRTLASTSYSWTIGKTCTRIGGIGEMVKKNFLGDACIISVDMHACVIK